MLAWLILHSGIAAAGTWLARRYALQRDLLDHPGERRSHAVATPRGGGIAIVVALLVAAVALAMRDPSQGLLLGTFGIGMTLVAGVGMVDDHRPLSPWVRLLVHAVAGAIFALAIQYVFGQVWLSLLAFATTVALTNIWNFMDGIDGIAASQALLLGVALASILGGSWMLIALALAAACAGFLPFNFPCARIFMGDVGSGAIGFAIAGLGAAAVGMQGLDVVWLLLPLSAFLVDAGFTLARRVMRSEHWWQPHVQHAYQVWARRSGHVVVTLAYVAWTLTGLATMTVFRGSSTIFMLAFCLVWYVFAALAWWTLQRLEPPAEPVEEVMKKDIE